MQYTEIMQETMDIDWFAVDQNGNIAHFASAGGLLPDSVAQSKEDNEILISFFNGLSNISDEVVTNNKAIEAMGITSDEAIQKYLKDFVLMSKRGLYSYDKKVIGDFYNNEYYLLSKPIRFLNLEHLPLNIRRLVSKTQVRGEFNLLSNLDFKYFSL